MSDLRQRAIAYFIASEPSTDPHQGPRASVSRSAVAPGRAGVVGAHEDVAPVAALLAAELRFRSGASCALLAGWSAGERLENRAGAASRPARRLAGSLAGRGLDACARSRTVTVLLPDDPAAACSGWQRALAAADCPSVLALAGPRPAGLDRLLGELALIVVVLGAAAGEEMGRLALAGLPIQPARVVARRPVSDRVARVLTSSSIATSRLLGADVTQAVGALS